MTVTLSYGHGYMTDCDDITGWSEIENGLTSALTCEDGDVFQIEGTCDDSGNEYAYYEYDFTPNISSNIYSKFLLKYKTSEASAGLAAKVALMFTSGDQVILSQSYNQTWTTVSGDITTDKTIDKIRFYADDYPDTVDSGTYQVYYDFALLHKGTFTFPHVARGGVSGGITFNLSPKESILGIPGRGGNVNQRLGIENPLIVLMGDMEAGTDETWGGSTVSYGEYLIDIVYNAATDPWQWFTCSEFPLSCQVAVAKPGLHISMEAGSGVQRLWSLPLRHYKLAPSTSTLFDRDSWLGLA